jgi:gliding motility-associated-like protein
LALDGLATLNLSYATNGFSVTASAVGAAAQPAPQPSDLSVFWNNGTRWLQLYGTLDSADQLMVVQTQFFGSYQLRLAERTGGFFFNAAGLTNRFITPNGDQKNDNTVFFFDNPNNSQVSGKIFDVRGRLVTGSLPAGPAANSLIWDGTAGGRPVPTGTYIYQLQSEGKTYTGTVFVIR